MIKSYCFQCVRTKLRTSCLWVLLAILMVVSCSETTRDNPPLNNNITKELSPPLQLKLSNLKKRSEKALQKAQQAIANELQDLKWQPGEIWLFQEYLKYRQDENIRQFVKDSSIKLSGHPFVAVFNPDSEPIDLPENPGKGFRRFTYYCVAPFGKPPGRASHFIKSFLSAKGEGYVLTHQLSVIIWSQERGLKLPPKVVNQKKRLLQEIADEQRSWDKGFSDLYAERTALLLMYGKPSPEEAMDWIETILDAQEVGGYWYAYKNIVTFDNETVYMGGVEISDTNHPTALSMLAIAVFLDRY